MVMYWFVLFTGLRASVIDFMLVPFAHRVGIESKFGEQAWEFIYNSTF
jgi:acyl-CoA-dependent ceramide synthase